MLLMLAGVSLFECVSSAQLASNGNDVNARLLLAQSLAAEGRRSESLEQAAIAVKLKPDSAVARNTFGMLLSHFGEMAAARQAFEQALKLDSGMANAHVGLALVLAQEGELVAAGSHLDRAAELLGATPGAAYAHLLRARIYGEQEDLEQASEQLTEAVRLRPDYADAWSDLGAARGAMQQDAVALEALERAVRLRSNDAVSRYRLGSQYLRDGKSRDAVTQLREALRLGYEERPALYKLERALRQTGDVQAAADADIRLKAVLRESEGPNGEAAGELNNRGVALEKSGDLQGALQKYEQALEFEPAQAVFRLNYALALCRAGRWTEGAVELREVTRQDPGNVQATRALSIALDQAAQADSSHAVGLKDGRRQP